MTKKPVVMWMVRSASLAPFYGITYRKCDMVEKMKERIKKYGPHANGALRIVRVTVSEESEHGTPR